jgi:hypothetical protein
MPRPYADSEADRLRYAMLLSELSEAELEALASAGQWPERYRGVAGLVTGPPEGGE